MTRYCGVLKEVGDPTGGGYVAMGREDAQGNVIVPVGGLVRVATEIPVIQIGDTRLEKIRVCKAELAGYLRQGDRVCVFVYGHLLRKKIIIGVKSETGPSWTMSFGRFVVTLLTYLTLWPFLVGLAGALIGGLVPMIIGSDLLATAGFGLGIAYGVGISLLSAVRLVKAYNEMRAV
ncbi:MAG TPA: hypothetical protein PK359_20115 [Burkholderiaceae bacterium]|nr:hypothetical protein [Burkholderiaceae bacterium]